MFGMLDYRAQKLYLILFGIPNFIIFLLWAIGIPLIAYHLGFKQSDAWFLQVAASIGFLLVAEIIAAAVSFIYDKLCFFIFTLIVDIVPYDGRTKAEAKAVVVNGRKALVLYETNKNPGDWTDEDMESLAGLDWVARLFFSERLRERVQALHWHFRNNPEDNFHGDIPRQVIENAGLKQGWAEKIISHRIWRLLLIRYSLFAFLIIFNPSGY